MELVALSNLSNEICNCIRLDNPWKQIYKEDYADISWHKNFIEKKKTGNP